MEKKIFFALCGLPLVLFIVGFSSLGMEGDDGSFTFLFAFLALFSFILGVWGVRILVKSNKKEERVLSLGFATLIASSVFILLCLLEIGSGIIEQFV
ncbi:MAG: hypothetical protein OEM27_08250 [Nitrospinota bacterium]|nr:hypothetical protein [Nitrospinota bacterium]